MRRVKAEYVGPVAIEPPLPAGWDGDLHAWRNPDTGKIVAVDHNEVPAIENYVRDPYQDGVLLVFHDTFTGLPK